MILRDRQTDKQAQMMMMVHLYLYFECHHITPQKAKSIVSVQRNQYNFSSPEKPPQRKEITRKTPIIHPNRAMSAVSVVPRVNRCLGEFTFPVQARMTGSDVTGQLRLGRGCHILAVYGVSLRRRLVTWK